MKNFTKLFALAVVILGFSATSFGQTYITSSAANAKAEVKSGISITKPESGPGSALNFGAFFTDGAIGTVKVNATNATTVDASSGVLPVAATASAAKFTLTAGAADLAYVIAVAPATLNVTHTDGTHSMIVDAIELSDGPSGTLTGGSPQVRYVGGTLHLTAGQTPGVYTSLTPFTVTVGWN